MGWHDLTARLEGPVVADVADYFRLRWHATTGERLPPPTKQAPAGPYTVQFAITNPEDLYPDLPRGSFRILEAYLRALRGAQRFIYIENQFLWSVEIVAALCEKLLHPPSPDFRVVLLLPAHPDSGGDDTRGQLRVLGEADREGRLVTSTLYARRESRSRSVYVHAKLAIVDDSWMTVGSANLNDRSLFDDTEANIIVQDHALVRGTRLRLWAEHLELPPDRVGG